MEDGLPLYVWIRVKNFILFHISKALIIIVPKSQEREGSDERDTVKRPLIGRKINNIP